MTEVMTKVVEVLVSNERDYYEGKGGTWISLPMDRNELELTIKPQTSYPRTIIAECEFPDHMPSFRINEFTSLIVLNDMLNKYSSKLVAALLVYTNDIERVQGLLETDEFETSVFYGYNKVTYTVGQVMYCEEVDSLSDLADIMIETGSVHGLKHLIPQELQSFVDRQQIAMHLQHNVGWVHDYKQEIAFYIKRKY